MVVIYTEEVVPTGWLFTDSTEATLRFVNLKVLLLSEAVLVFYRVPARLLRVVCVWASRVVAPLSLLGSLRIPTFPRIGISGHALPTSPKPFLVGEVHFPPTRSISPFFTGEAILLERPIHLIRTRDQGAQGPPSVECVQVGGAVSASLVLTLAIEVGTAGGHEVPFH